LFSEEIPARMQARAAEDLRKLVTDRLVDAGLVYEGAKAFVTPRRLALAVQGVPVRQPDVKEEKKGPRVGAPAGAIEGFVRAAGLKSIEEATVKPDKKGDFYVAVIEKPRLGVKGFLRDSAEMLHDTVTEAARVRVRPRAARKAVPARTADAVLPRGSPNAMLVMRNVSAPKASRRPNTSAIASKGCRAKVELTMRNSLMKMPRGGRPVIATTPVTRPQPSAGWVTVRPRIRDIRCVPLICEI